MTKSNGNKGIKPIYCRQCRSQKTFKRSSENDVKFESGAVLENAWKCSVCGHITYYPAKHTVNIEGVNTIEKEVVNAW